MKMSESLCHQAYLREIYLTVIINTIELTIINGTLSDPRTKI